MFKVGDIVKGIPSFARADSTFIRAGEKYKIENVDANGKLRLPSSGSRAFWCHEFFVLAEMKCSKCNMDPCSCEEDEELLKPMKFVRTKQDQEQFDKFCAELDEAAKKMRGIPVKLPPVPTEPKTYKHKPLPACALTSWPSAHMTAAILLNELDE